MRDGRRVVVTGIGMVTPIGNTIDAMKQALTTGLSGVRYMPEWDGIEHMRTRLGAPCPDVNEKLIPRTARRTMDRVAILAALSARDAIADAGLGAEDLASASCGVSFGSTEGGAESMSAYMLQVFGNRSLLGLTSSLYLRFMNHTCAANIASMYGCRGPMIAPSTACVSASQCIGFAYDAIRLGRAELMLAGGAEELHFWAAGVFDILRAASAAYNDHPQRSPRPFDRDRDGLVLAEGAGCLVLEDLDHARARGARPWAEIAGYATSCDGDHLTHPNPAGMAEVMRLALKDAALAPGDIGHINAHATATVSGDRAEARAINEVFGDKVPVSAIKGYMGHTLGACGATESIASIVMMRDGFAAPTLNLENPDPELAPIDHVMGGVREIDPEIVMNNNFAFGGVNTSLIFRKHP